MFYILFSLILFCLSVVTHIYFCRRLPKTSLQARAYIFIAVLCLIIYIAGVDAVQHSRLLDPASLLGLPLIMTGGIIFILLIPVYLSFYVLTQLMSPSKKILLSLLARGSLTYKQLLAYVEEEDFINTRLKDLCTSGCVRQMEGRYVLSVSGRKIATLLDIMQLVLGRNIGG